MEIFCVSCDLLNVDFWIKWIYKIKNIDNWFKKKKKKKKKKNQNCDLNEFYFFCDFLLFNLIFLSLYLILTYSTCAIDLKQMKQKKKKYNVWKNFYKKELQLFYCHLSHL